MKVLWCSLLLAFAHTNFWGLPSVLCWYKSPDLYPHFRVSDAHAMRKYRTNTRLRRVDNGTSLETCTSAVTQITLTDSLKIPMKAVLASVNQDEQWRLSQQTINWFGQQNHQSPILQKLELRLGSNDLSLTRQQYGIRVSPNAFGLSKYQRNYQQAQSGVLQAEAETYWNEALLQRYETIVSYHFAQELATATQKLDSLLQVQEQVFRGMLREGLEVKIKDVVENEQDRQALQLDHTQYQHEKEQAQQTIRQFMASSGALSLELQQFIPVTRIEQVLATVQANALAVPLAEAKIRQAQLGMVQSEMDLLKMRNREYISFFQFGYERAPKTPTLDDDLFLRLGFNVPLNSKNRMKNNELNLEQYELNAKNTLALSRRKQEVDLQSNKVQQLLKEYKLLKEQEEKNLLLQILTDPSLRTSVSPAELVEIKLLQQKKQVARLKLSQELTQQYIQLLYLNGHLMQKPLLNYLSTNLEPW